MLFDPIPFERAWSTLHGRSRVHRGIIAFVQLLERRLGASLLYDAERIPRGDVELLDLFEIAEKLRAAGVISHYERTWGYPDEPRLAQWVALYDKHSAGGGLATKSSRKALTAALAESLERHVWSDMDDYFDSPRRATVLEMAARGKAVLPARFAGFSPEQRARNARLTLSGDARYLWIRGYSHTRRVPVWVPAQVVSGYYGGKNMQDKQGEPIILTPITTGLATGPTREFAFLNGALEVIERDAFMITWLNQLSAPTLDLAELGERLESLKELLAIMARYRLTAEAVRLPTDAPTYVVCAIVRDESGVGPAVTIGLKAHRDAARAVEGALLEAVRIRRTIRNHKPLPDDKKKDHLVHTERAVYWGAREHSHKLDFLSRGKKAQTDEPWEEDTEREHLARIIRWCAMSGYECASVTLTKSRKNVSPWHIEMVVMPELIPMHQNEHFRYEGGERRMSVPKLFGFEPRTEPFLDEPHPFA